MSLSILPQRRKNTVEQIDRIFLIRVRYSFSDQKVVHFLLRSNLIFSQTFQEVILEHRFALSLFFPFLFFLFDIVIFVYNYLDITPFRRTHYLLFLVDYFSHRLMPFLVLAEGNDVDRLE
jgi:hypothetical protein